MERCATKKDIDVDIDINTIDTDNTKSIESNIFQVEDLDIGYSEMIEDIHKKNVLSQIGKRIQIVNLKHIQI